MLATRSFQKFVWLTRRRCICSSRQSSSVWRRAWETLKGFYSESNRNNFDKEFISKAHKSDGINMEKWLLIYRDQGANQSFVLLAITFPTVLIGITVIAYDFYSNEHKDRFSIVRRLTGDLEEIGIFAVIPATALLIVIVILLRLHQMRLMRIYQNRMNGEEYIAIGSKNVVWRQQIPFDRSCASACYFSYGETHSSDLFLKILVGNMQIKKQRFLISDDGFRANNYRTYMLNETSTVPRL